LAHLLDGVAPLLQLPPHDRDEPLQPALIVGGCAGACGAVWGVCVVCVWRVWGVCVACVWGVCGACVWRVCGVCVALRWRLSSSRSRRRTWPR
jgi:hypothetical protein